MSTPTLIVIIFSLLWLLSVVLRKLTGRRNSGALGVPFSTSIKCPRCHGNLEIEEMLNSAVFFSPGAIVFDCDHCHDRVYFSPYEDCIETGTLACSPVVDTIPYEKFGYRNGFEMESEIRDGILRIHIKENCWAIPRYGLWNERPDIPCPNKPLNPDAPPNGGAPVS